MEKTTLINGNGQPYERSIPEIVILGCMNEVALDYLQRQTGIEFKEMPHDVYTGQPETWEQFSKVFLSYNWLTHGINNWDGNKIFLRFNCNIPLNKTLYYHQDGREFIGVRGIN